MGGCRCSYKNCKNTTKTTENIHFFHYPVKHKERCRIWIDNAAKPQFCDLEEEQLRNKVICELHFEDRYFPNSQKKRLLQAAVPTLDAGCMEAPSSMDQPMSMSTELQDVQILPANADGTIFVLDTDSMFSRVVPSQKIESYIYKNGSIVPLDSKASNNSDVFYSLNNMGYETSQKNNYDGNQMNYVVAEPEFRTVHVKSEVADPAIHDANVSFDHDMDYLNFESPRAAPQNKQALQRSSSSVVPEKKSLPVKQMPVKTGNKSALERNYLRKIRQHSREIATIKRMLKHKSNIGEKPDNTSILSALKKQLPASLYAILNLNLNNNCEMTDEDVQFFSTIKKASPEVYNLLIEKYNWNIPSADLIESLASQEVAPNS